MQNGINSHNTTLGRLYRGSPTIASVFAGKVSKSHNSAKTAFFLPKSFRMSLRHNLRGNPPSALKSRLSTISTGFSTPLCQQFLKGKRWNFVQPPQRNPPRSFLQFRHFADLTSAKACIRHKSAPRYGRMGKRRPWRRFRFTAVLRGAARRRRQTRRSFQSSRAPCIPRRRWCKTRYGDS